MNILGLFPLTGNGGIASWTKRFLATFPNDEYVFFPVSLSPKPRIGNEGIVTRVTSGFRALHHILDDVEDILKKKNIDILHTTTSGSIGSFRDIKVAKLCKKYGVKSVMHCRYGCISENINSKTLVGILLRKSMSLYDQIWVLDKRSYNTLKGIDSLSGKVFLTPNSIEVKEEIDTTPKTYNTIAFVGNLLPTKGLYELVEAATRCDVTLHIIGPGDQQVLKRIKNIAGSKIDKSIYIHGKLPNMEALKFIRNVDIVALPTYYQWEAFPISIIEAMSLSKMVISCPRAAVPDMLTDLDGNMCGKLVKPKSVSAIVEAIEWCQKNKVEADIMCAKAYEKVYSCYRTDVVYDLYRQNYNSLIKE